MNAQATKKAKASDKTEKKVKRRGAPPEYLFKPGAEWKGNAKGRPKGSRQRLGEAFIGALQADFEEHGPVVIEKVRKDRPADYLKVIASLMPKELNVNTNQFQDMTDDELAAGITALQSVLASQGIGSRAKEKEGRKPAQGVSTLQ